MGRSAWDQAIDEYEAALDVDPGSIVAKDNLVLVHNNWGISLFRQHKFEEAKAEWEEALKMNPYDRNAKQNLAVLKTTLARINAAPKPPVKPAAEIKEGAPGKSPAAPEEEQEEATSSGPKMLGQPKPAPEATSSGPKMLGHPRTEETSSGPKVINQPKSEASSSGGKVMNATSDGDTSSGIKLMNQPKASQPTAAQEEPNAVVIMNSNHQPETVPSVPAPPAVPPTAPEPPQVSAPPPMDMSSPYSFVDSPPPVKPGAEVSSPYVMPANLSNQARTRPYTAPQVTPPPKPVNSWAVPVQTTTTTTNTTAEPSSTATPPEADSSANFEEQLSAIEQKLNGKKQKNNMPLLKRIEKLETSIAGKISSGSLQERIEALRKSCGL
jgi:Tetratricopeptide repeat